MAKQQWHQCCPSSGVTPVCVFLLLQFLMLFLPCTLCFTDWLPVMPNSFAMHFRHVRKRTLVLLHEAVRVLWSDLFRMSVTSTPGIVSNLYAVPRCSSKNLSCFQCHPTVHMGDTHHARTHTHHTSIGDMPASSTA